MVVLLATVLAACASGGSSSPPTPAPSSPTGAPVAEVAASVPVGGEPIGIATGAGSIWVVNSEFRTQEPGSVSRVVVFTDGSLWLPILERGVVLRVTPPFFTVE